MHFTVAHIISALNMERGIIGPKQWNIVVWIVCGVHCKTPIGKFMTIIYVLEKIK